MVHISEFSKLWAEGRKIPCSLFFGQKQNYLAAAVKKLWTVNKLLRNGLLQNNRKNVWLEKDACYQLTRQLILALSTIVSAFRLEIAKT
jgi:hypothetical protein